MQLSEFQWPETDIHILSTSSYISTTLNYNKSNTNELQINLSYEDDKTELVKPMSPFKDVFFCQKGNTKDNSDGTVSLEVKLKPNVLSSKRDNRQFQFVFQKGDDIVSSTSFTTKSKIYRNLKKKRYINSDEEDINLISFETLSGYASEIDDFYLTSSRTNSESNTNDTNTDKNKLISNSLENLDSDDLMNMFAKCEDTSCCYACKRNRDHIISLSTQMELMQKELKRLRSDYVYTNPSTDVDL
jgi:ribosomal protein S8